MSLAPQISRSLRRRRRTPGRGFTLLELVVVAAVSSVLFLMVIRWVLTLGAASSVTLDNASAQRTAQVAVNAFADDMARSRPCAIGVPTALRRIAPDSVTFSVARADSPGTFSLVTWTIQPRGSAGAWVLVRSVADAGSPSSKDPCPGAGGSLKTFDGNLIPVQSDRILTGDLSVRPAFFAVADGQRVTDPVQAWGDCTAGQDADRCFARSVGVNWTFASPVDTAAPIGVTRTYSFATTGEGLS